MWKYHLCYGYKINRAFHTKKLLTWNGWVFHILHGLLETKFVFSCWKYPLYIFFSKLANGRNPPNPAIWLVPRAGGILPSSPLTRPGGIVGSFIHKFVCCLWKSKNYHFQTIFLLKLALLLALAREKWILLFRQKLWRENQAVSLKNRLSKAKQVARDVASLLVCNRAVSTAILLLCTVYWTFLLCL